MLRGINVSGQKKVKMDDLRSIYESLGFQNVITYIKSGNVIFEYQNTNKSELKVKIEQSIEKNYPFQVPVEIRTEHELENKLGVEATTRNWKTVNKLYELTK